MPNAPVLAWRIYYATAPFTVASSADAVVERGVRRDGVLAVVYFHDRPERTVSYGRDQYELPHGTVLEGADVSDAERERVRALAADDENWPMTIDDGKRVAGIDPEPAAVRGGAHVSVRKGATAPVPISGGASALHTPHHRE